MRVVVANPNPNPNPRRIVANPNPNPNPNPRRVGYDDAHPCPKCEGMLRGVGVRDVRHTSGVGRVVRRALGPPLPHLLAQRSVCAPLAILLRDQFGGVPCSRLSEHVMLSTSRDLRVTTAAY